MYYLLFIVGFLHKIILLSPAKVKVETKICKKLIDHNGYLFLRLCKSNIII